MNINEFEVFLHDLIKKNDFSPDPAKAFTEAMRHYDEYDSELSDEDLQAAAGGTGSMVHDNES